MADRKDQMMDEAIDWTIRLRHGGSGEWQRFTGWLEADPAHLRAYEEVSAFDEGLERLFAQPAVSALKGKLPSFTRRWLVGGAAAAAALAVAVFSWPAMQGGRDLYPVETIAGQRLSVTLAGGSVVQVNGDSRLLLDKDDPRFAQLVQGEALFSVVHDASAPFRVEAGAVSVRNLGTVFDVRRDGPEVEVAVAEGAVLFSAGGRDVRLAEGETARLEGGAIESGRVEPATVGGWRDGQLSYSSASLAEVARDFSRASGIKVSVDPEVAGQRFSGVIMIDGDRELSRRRLAALLDVKVVLAEDGWVLAPRDR